MNIVAREIAIRTRGGSEVVDITSAVGDAVGASGVREGIVTVFVVGSTASVTTTEFEPGLRRDIPEALDRLVPPDIRYRHDDTWHDGNGHAHVRASLLGPSLTVPLVAGVLRLGTWQQIVVIDHDNRPRERQIVLQIMGE